MKRYRLLIVDDEEIIRKGLLARIEYFGFPDLDVAEAASGAEALSLMEREPVHLALVDISMPGMSGLELIERAKERGLRVRFVLLSGYAEFAYAQKAITLGVQAYLNKPVSNEVLRAHIEELLAQLRAQERTEARRTGRGDAERELNALLSGGPQAGGAYPELLAKYPDLFSGRSVLYLALLHISGRSGPGGRPTQAQLSALRPVLRAALMDESRECLVADCYENPQRLYAVFLLDSAENARQRVERAFLAVQQSLRQHENVQVTMGVSRPVNALDAECVSEAREAGRQRLILGRSNSYFFEDLSSFEAQPLPEAELELLHKNMMRGDRRSIRRQLEQLFSKEQLESRKAVYLHILWVRVAGLMMSAFSSIDAATMNRLLTQISRAEQIADSGEILRTLLDMTDACLRGEPARDQGGAAKIQRALRYIREHYNEEIVINDLAARLDLNPSYFSSMFKKETGQPTLQYITGLRVERAKEYLAKTDLSVAVIAKNVGYDDSQYFFRIFKKVTGMTPLQYRQTPHETA